MANQPGMQGSYGTSGATRAQGATGVSDPTYDLISVIYHALQGAETYRKYEHDAQGDQQLAQFFRQAYEEEQRRAQQGRDLLAQTLQRQGAGQQLQSGKGGTQQGGSSSMGGQQSQSGSSSRQMGSSSSPSSQQSQSGSSGMSSSRQQSQHGSSSGSSTQHGSSSSDKSRR